MGKFSENVELMNHYYNEMINIKEDYNISGVFLMGVKDHYKEITGMLSQINSIDDLDDNDVNKLKEFYDDLFYTEREVKEDKAIHNYRKSIDDNHVNINNLQELYGYFFNNKIEIEKEKANNEKLETFFDNYKNKHEDLDDNEVNQLKKFYNYLLNTEIKNKDEKNNDEQLEVFFDNYKKTRECLEEIIKEIAPHILDEYYPTPETEAKKTKKIENEFKSLFILNKNANFMGFYGRKFRRLHDKQVWNSPEYTNFVCSVEAFAKEFNEHKEEDDDEWIKKEVKKIDERLNAYMKKVEGRGNNSHNGTKSQKYIVCSRFKKLFEANFGNVFMEDVKNIEKKYKFCGKSYLNVHNNCKKMAAMLKKADNGEDLTDDNRKEIGDFYRDLIKLKTYAEIKIEDADNKKIYMNYYEKMYKYFEEKINKFAPQKMKIDDYKDLPDYGSEKMVFGGIVSNIEWAKKNHNGPEYNDFVSAFFDFYKGFHEHRNDIKWIKENVENVKFSLKDYMGCAFRLGKDLPYGTKSEEYKFCEKSFEGILNEDFWINYDKNDGENKIKDIIKNINSLQESKDQNIPREYTDFVSQYSKFYSGFRANRGNLEWTKKNVKPVYKSLNSYLRKAEKLSENSTYGTKSYEYLLCKNEIYNSLKNNLWIEFDEIDGEKMIEEQKKQKEQKVQENQKNKTQEGLGASPV